MPGVIEERTNPLPFQRSGVPIRIGKSQFDGAIEALFWHANLPKRGRGPNSTGEVEDSVYGILRVESGCHFVHGISRGARIEGDRMRQDDAVSLRMRKTERAPKHVAELVMEGHGSASEDDSTKPRTVECVMPWTDGTRCLDNLWERLGKGDNPFARQ